MLFGITAPRGSRIKAVQAPAARPARTSARPVGGNMPLGRRGRGRRRRGGGRRGGSRLSPYSGGRHFGRHYGGGGYGFGIPYRNPWGYGGAYSTWGDPLMFMESPPYDPTKKPKEEKKAIKDLKKKLKDKEKELKSKEKEIKKQLKKNIKKTNKQIAKLNIQQLQGVRQEKAHVQMALGAVSIGEKTLYGGSAAALLSGILSGYGLYKLTNSKIFSWLLGILVFGGLEYFVLFASLLTGGLHDAEKRVKGS
jgi:hypothetical protein